MVGNMDIITIDGSRGEGGGQILRTSLALSLVTGRPFRIERIRAGRRKPGLLRQHLTAVHAAREVGGARVKGAELGSGELFFEPGEVRGGEYRFSVGTAGSATLVLQTVLVPLAVAGRPSELTLEGGTHNPAAPPFDFLARTFMPAFARMGPLVSLRLERHGFYPAGGGRFVARIEPCPALRPFVLETRGEPVAISARAIVSNLDERIAVRELAVVRGRLGLPREACRAHTLDDPAGPGNVLMIDMAAGEHVEVVTGFGEKGVSAEQVANTACDEAQGYLDARVPVCQHLADQLLLPLALAGGGSFRTLAPSGHTRTNAEVVERFLPVQVVMDTEAAGTCRISVLPHRGREE